jgi:hypothetical protein
VEIPKIISVDDHLVEPPTLWAERLPAKYRDRGPRVVRLKGTMAPGTKHIGPRIVSDPDDPLSRWCDQWYYDDYIWPLTAAYASVGPLREVTAMTPITYDDVLPGCYQQSARLGDMDTNNTEASLCFPTFPRFCGQAFTERADKELALLCVRAYSDFMIDEWCAGDGYGRLIPLTIIPLWDAGLAAAEIRRCADKGSHSITFPDVPAFLGLPGLHGSFWDPVFRACEDTETVINMHIGSSSTLPKTSDDAPTMVWTALLGQYSQNCLVDWLSSGLLERYKKLRIALSEGQIGWIPYYLERLDSIWNRAANYEADMHERLPRPPSSYFKDRVFCCVFDDEHGLRTRDAIGDRQISFEVDYPHADSTWPTSSETVLKLVTASGMDDREIRRFVRGNAIDFYGLGRWGLSA